MPNLTFTIDKYSAGDVQQIHTNISSAKTYFNKKTNTLQADAYSRRMGVGGVGCTI